MVDQCLGWRLRHPRRDAPLGAPQRVIFARRENARREEDGSPGSVSWGALSVGRDGQYRRLRGMVPRHEALRFQPGMRFHSFRDCLASFSRHAGQ